MPAWPGIGGGVFPDAARRFARRWGPAILMMGLIFAFSATPMKVTQPSPASFRLTWRFVILKGGHLLGYALLALSLRHGLRRKGRKGTLAVLLMVLVYALSDELHQSFVAGRTGQLMDVGIDLAGAVIGLLIVKRSHTGRMISIIDV